MCRRPSQQLASGLGVAVALAVTCFTTLHVRADTIYVCWDGTGDYLTIQAGVNAASDGDEIVVCNGTYTGSGNRDVTITDKNITLRSANGPENCIIDCQGGSNPGNWHRAFNITAVPGKHVEIEGFTIINGCHTTGAAIHAEMFVVGSPAIYYTIRNCRFENNDAYTGLC